MELTQPCIGIVGSAGAYGRWLRVFFSQRMGLRVLGHDPADACSDPAEDLLEYADVLLFAVPIRATTDVIGEWAARSAGREAGKLWLDVTSLKSAPVAAMLASQADVAGLHPMTAPPKSPTLKGRVLAVCRARLNHWSPWLESVQEALEAECVDVDPDRHDRAMALVQAMVHATHLAQADVLRAQAALTGSVDELLPLRSVAFELDMAVAARILSQNPTIYEDIQFENPHVPAVLRALADRIDRIAALVEQGDEAARAGFRDEMLTANRSAFGVDALASGNDTFERVGYLLADLTDAHTLSVHLPEDSPGSLRLLLAVFEAHGVNIASLHSSRTRAGELHFRFGFEHKTTPGSLQDVARAIRDAGLGRVLDG